MKAYMKIAAPGLLSGAVSYYTVWRSFAACAVLYGSFYGVLFD